MRQILALASLLGLVSSTSAASCTLETFKKAPPTVFGVEILEILTEEVNGWNEYATSMPTLPSLPVEMKPVDFCNVTVFYTHPGLNDTVRVSVWLPPKDEDWNGRFLGQGGGGWAGGGLGGLSQAVALGYAAADTNTGHTYFGDPADYATSSSSWALTSPGNVNLHLLQNFGYRALDEMTWIGKDITKLYYRKDIAYSYWNGCSTGGRQGLTMAQRYPSQYQGILSACPAINWVTFVVAEYYAHIKMKEMSYYPPACEMKAITSAAIEACDELDGVKDGVVAAYKECKFDSKSVVGQKYECTAGDTRKITREAAEIANVAWNGPVKDGKQVWFGVLHETHLPGHGPKWSGLAQTDCDENNKNCKSRPFPISVDWIRNWVLKDPDFDVSNINDELFHHILRTSRQQYHSLIDSADPDLSHFKNAGGKLILWHGLADQLIPPNGSLNYYERVKNTVPEIDDFMRYFEAPGVAHCMGGDGAFPATAMNSLVDWVEHGKTPEQLDGVSVPALSSDPQAKPHSRPICRYPKVAAYKGGDWREASSFECREEFGKIKAKVEGGKDEL